MRRKRHPVSVANGVDAERGSEWERDAAGRRRRFVVSAAHDDDDDDDTCIAESHLTPTDQAIVARNAVRIYHSVNVSFLY